MKYLTDQRLRIIILEANNYSVCIHDNTHTPKTSLVSWEGGGGPQLIN